VRAMSEHVPIGRTKSEYDHTPAGRGCAIHAVKPST